MLSNILHVNDGSEHAFRAFAMALTMVKQNNSDRSNCIARALSGRGRELRHVAYWHFASFRYRAAIWSFSERSGHRATLTEHDLGMLEFWDDRRRRRSKPP